MNDDDFGYDNATDRLPAFLARESFTDCAGVRREFELTVRELDGHGFAGRAHEVTADEHGGYIFQSFSEGSLTMALARLRGNVRAGIAQRFLIPEDGHLTMPSDRVRGRIAMDGMVIDGKLLDWAGLQALLSMHEGWDFELRIPFEPDW